MQRKEQMKRFMVFILGLFFMASGITIIIYGGLGNSPISSTPYIFSRKFTNISLGKFTFAWNMVFILGQIVILRKDYEVFQLVQIPLTFIFAAFVDITKEFFSFIKPDCYGTRFLVLLIGCFVLAAGVTCTVIAKITMNCGEAFANAIAKKYGWEFGYVKVGFDCTLVGIAILCSMIFFHKLIGVREGTIVTAAISGFIIRFLTKIFKPLADPWLERA